ncbi:hypothetical protein [Leucobacter sp. M11]|uniref:hypothetical protein n=1 Tax=Leucobacter sp. M11 TaxID=2993565 RepID=UPI002D7E6F97|nr:hypothetical protein [Leucobacter sp. M11]MEB4615862.1 hypothetical protein [Leucobacter sp. M11]
MRTFLKKLGPADEPVGQAIHILDTFEALHGQGATLSEIAAVAGALAHLPAGVTDARGETLAEWYPQDPYRPAGARGPVRESATHKEFGPRDEPLGNVWLGGVLDRDPLASLILDRMAAAAELALLRAAPGEIAPAGRVSESEAKLRILFGPGATSEQRRTAAFGLGIHPDSRAAVAVCADPDAAVARFAKLRGRAVTVLDGHAHVLLTEADDESRAVLAETASRVGIGRWLPIERLPESRIGAERALGFTDPSGLGREHYSAEGLGGLIHLAELPTSVLLADPDITAVGRIGASAQGAQALAVLEEAVWERSLRAVAVRVNFHHSSVAARVKRFEEELGLSLAEPAGRLRAQTGILGWRVLSGRGEEPAAEHAD